MKPLSSLCTLNLGSNGNIPIKGLTFDDEVQILFSDLPSGTTKISFYRCKFKNIHFGEIFELETIFNCCVIENMVSSKSGNIHFNGCNLFQLAVESSEASISMHKTSIRTLHIGGTGVKSLKYSGIIYNNSVNIEEFKDQRKIELGTIFQLDIDLTEKTDKPRYFHFSGCVVNEIHLSGENHSEIVFENVFNNILQISNFINHNKLRFYGINRGVRNFSKALTIQKSNLVNTNLFRFNFNSYNLIEMLDSYLAGIQFYNVDWKNDLLTIKDKKDKVNLKQNKESYRQLKLAMNQQMDKRQELSFYAQEMRLVDRLTPWLKFSTIFDKLNLRFSYWISNFGQYFLKPLVIWFLLIAILYSLNHCIFKDGSFTINISEMDINWKTFFSLMNPIKFSNYDSKVVHWFTSLTAQFISAYFVYILIRFIRKYVNK